MTAKRPLPAPIERLIDQSAPVHVAVLWRELSELRTARRRKRSPSARALLALAACFAMLVGSVLALTLGSRLGGREERAALAFLSEHAQGTARVASALPAQIVAGDRYRALDLNDGSRVTVAKGAQLDVLESSPRTVSFALRHGRVRFDVRPRGPRNWRIECGAFSVEVVGTKFVLERSDEEVSVNVLHGAVLVRGATIPDGVQRLEAGRSLRARAPDLERLGASDASPVTPVVLPLAVPQLPASDPASIEDRAEQEELAAEQADVAAEQAELAAGQAADLARVVRRGRAGGRDALPAQPSVNVDSGPESEVEALFQAADSARLRGRAPEAAASLARILERHADDPRAPLAGFALARLQLGALAQPALAAESLKLSISLGLPRALLEDAYGKLVEAYEEAGNESAACKAFGEYQWRFPNGERVSRPPQQCQVGKTR